MRIMEVYVEGDGSGREKMRKSKGEGEEVLACGMQRSWTANRRERVIKEMLICILVSYNQRFVMKDMSIRWQLIIFFGFYVFKSYFERMRKPGQIACFSYFTQKR